MKTISALNAIDFYKSGHVKQYVPGTQLIYSNFTCRSDKHANVLPDFDHKTVFFGLQAVCQYLLIDLWKDTFFRQPKDEVVAKYQRRMDRALGPGAVTTEHIAALWDLGYLPLEIKALPEGSRVDMRVPPLTMVNTHPDFFWITNYIETQFSAEMWKVITSATTAYEYRRLFESYAKETGTDLGFVDFQGHDFSARGMSGIWDGATSGAGHLLSFKGTDTVLAIDFLEEFYPDRHNPDALIGASVPATEHSIMQAGGFYDELETFQRLIAETYPSGIVSIVSDTWDFWQVLNEYTKTLKKQIMGRDGKVVFRPDSGDPVEIICGLEVADMSKRKDLEEAKLYMMDSIIDEVRRDTPFAEEGDSKATGYFRFADKVYKLVVEIDWDRYDKQYYYMDGNDIASCEEVTLTAEQKGAVETLWDIFGGTVTDKGFKTLDSHVGLIYGDSISLDRAGRILKRLKAKGFSSGNIVFGIGSYTYQYVTRDTFGTAIKATYGVVNGEGRELFKDPKTDDGVKKSARGLIRIEYEDGHYVMHDQQTTDQEAGGLLETVFHNGKMVRMQTLSDIRQRLSLSNWPQVVPQEAVTA